MHWLILAGVCAVVNPPAVESASSYLHEMHIGSDRQTVLKPIRYNPQPGDIVLFDDHSTFTTKIYNYFGTGRPLHAGVVFRRADGTYAILEAGTNAVMKVFVFDLEPRLQKFDGTILIRRSRKAMSAEQAAKLADFANAQEGKPYAIARLLLQLTPFRPRSHAVLTHLFGRTVPDRDRWICSELVMASLAVAEVWSIDEFPANAMYPRDLCYDERYDLRSYYETPALWYPRAELSPHGNGVRVGHSISDSHSVLP